MPPRRRRRPTPSNKRGCWRRAWRDLKQQITTDYRYFRPGRTWLKSTATSPPRTNMLPQPDRPPATADHQSRESGLGLAARAASGYRSGRDSDETNATPVPGDANPPGLRIGNRRLDNRLILAPMAGVTDRPFRGLCRQHGAGLAVSEMLAANPALRGSRKSSERADHSGEPGPIAVQIAGADPAQMAEAARFSCGRRRAAPATRCCCCAARRRARGARPGRRRAQGCGSCWRGYGMAAAGWRAYSSQLTSISSYSVRYASAPLL